jgi:hypothetical protein
MKTRNNIFILDNYEAARAAELFGQAVPAERHDRLRAVVILTLIAVVVALAATAFAATDTPNWTGTADDLTFTLRYDANRAALLRIGGDRYDCDMTGKDPRQRTGEATKVYSIVHSSGGRCDAFLGGTMGIGAPQAGGVLLRIRNDKEAHEATLRQQ